VPKSVNVFSLAGFRYRVLSPLDKSIVLRRFHLPYDPITFFLYQDMVFKEDEGIKPQNAFLKPLAIVFLALLGVLFSLNFFFSGFGSKSKSIQATQPARTTQTQTMPITYEELIEEQEPPKPQEQEPPKPKEELPKEPTYFLALEKPTHPKVESLDLTPREPKIVYLP
jgi:hypothetical protein